MLFSLMASEKDLFVPERRLAPQFPYSLNDMILKGSKIIATWQFLSGDRGT